MTRLACLVTHVGFDGAASRRLALLRKSEVWSVRGSMLKSPPTMMGKRVSCWSVAMCASRVRLVLLRPLTASQYTDITRCG